MKSLQGWDSTDNSVRIVCGIPLDGKCAEHAMMLDMCRVEAIAPASLLSGKNGTNMVVATPTATFAMASWTAWTDLMSLAVSPK